MPDKEGNLYRVVENLNELLSYDYQFIHITPEIENLVVEKKESWPANDWYQQFECAKLASFYQPATFTSYDYWYDRYIASKIDHRIVIFENLDFTKFKGQEIFDSLISIVTKSFDAGRTIEIKRIFFLECKFGSLSGLRLANIALDEARRGFFKGATSYKKNGFDFKFQFDFINSCISDFSLEAPEGQRTLVDLPFHNCFIDKFSLAGNGDMFCYLNGSSIGLIHIDRVDIHLQNGSVSLFKQMVIGGTIINVSNISIFFNQELLSSLNKNETKEFWGTTKYVYNNVNGLELSKPAIERQLAYFMSNDGDFVKRFLFWFHAGYTNVLIPLISSVFFFVISFALLYFGLSDDKNALSSALWPLDLYKDVIFKPFNFNYEISFPKIGLFFSGFGFYYSFFCFGFALKKRYGFKFKSD